MYIVDAAVTSIDSKLIIKAYPTVSIYKWTLKTSHLFLTLKVHFGKYASILPESLVLLITHNAVHQSSSRDKGMEEPLGDRTP